jgi:hypothetical protein
MGMRPVGGVFKGIGKIPVVVSISGSLAPVNRESFKVELEKLAKKYHLKVKETGRKSSKKKAKKKAKKK